MLLIGPMQSPGFPPGVFVARSRAPRDRPRALGPGFEVTGPSHRRVAEPSGKPPSAVGSWNLGPPQHDRRPRGALGQPPGDDATVTTPRGPGAPSWAHPQAGSPRAADERGFAAGPGRPRFPIVPRPARRDGTSGTRDHRVFHRASGSRVLATPESRRFPIGTTSPHRWPLIWRVTRPSPEAVLPGDPSDVAGTPAEAAGSAPSAPGDERRHAHPVGY